MKHCWNRNGNLCLGFQISTWENGSDAWSIFVFLSSAFETIIYCFIFAVSYLLDTTRNQGGWLPFLYCLALNLRVRVKLQLQSSHRCSTCVWVILLPPASSAHFSSETGIIHTAKWEETQEKRHSSNGHVWPNTQPWYIPIWYQKWWTSQLTRSDIRRKDLKDILTLTIACSQIIFHSIVPLTGNKAIKRKNNLTGSEGAI